MAYVGQASGQYGEPIDCRVDELLDHYKPEVTITNLKSGATYYFSVKAYGEDKGEYIESDYSNEIHISMPLPLPGTSCGEGLVYDCVGNCVDQAKAWSWIGDWYCDDGTWGMDLRCDAFDNDGGDCESSNPGDPCAPSKIYDCVGKCVDEQKAESWIGDGYCDDGTWEMDLRCDAFDNDGGDCD